MKRRGKNLLPDGRAGSLELAEFRQDLAPGQKEPISPQVKTGVMQGTVQNEERPFYSIPELAERWRCSRSLVYNLIRGERVLDLAANGRKGKSHKLIPFDVVLRIEREKMKVFR